MDFRGNGKGDFKYEYKTLPKIKNEEDVEEYVRVAQEYFPKWTRGKYDRIKIPKFNNPIEQETWEFEQIRRCIEGHDGLPGRMYFYFHYCWIQNVSGGFIRPDFRITDVIWFHLVESCEWGNYNQGGGIICVKRRRAGFSWKQACDALYESIFKEGSQTSMTSKSEDDAKDLLSKVHKIDEKLPTFLKQPKASKTQDSVTYGRREKDELGNIVVKGSRSTITVVAPSDTSLEGGQAGKLVIDEVGKIPNVDTIWSMGEPILMEEMDRKGVPILFGTAGSQDKDGVGQKDFWINHESYALQRFFFPGWAGLSSDEFGNDDIEKAVRYILKEREKKLKISEEKYIQYLQQYPLYIEEAFLSNGNVGVGNRKNINKQLDVLDSQPNDVVIGKFEVDSAGSVSFIPNTIYDTSGKVKMHHRPNKSLEYGAGADPADHDHVQNGSDLSMYIVSKQKGVIPPTIACSMTYRTDNVDDWYEQSAYALIYFSSKVLIETNRNGMIKWYQNNGYFYLLKLEPLQKAKIKKNQPRSVGVRATAASNREMERCVNEYTTDYCDLIEDKDLLIECTVYGEKNTDRVFAFGWALLGIEDEYISQERKDAIKKALPKTKMRMINGKLKRVKL